MRTSMKLFSTKKETKNNKITNELAKSSTSSMFSNSIPVLRKTRSEIDPRLNDPKYKAVF